MIDQLKSLGIGEAMAWKLLTQYGAQRIREVLSHARAAGHPAGFLIKALREGWTWGNLPGTARARSSEERKNRYLSGKYAALISH